MGRNDLNKSMCEEFFEFSKKMVQKINEFCRIKKCSCLLERVLGRCCMNHSSSAKISNTQRAGPDHLNTSWEGSW